MAIEDSKGYDLLDRLAEEFAERFRRGERPSFKEYADRYPELADDIRELFPALVKVGRVEEICQDRDEVERGRAAIPPLTQVGDYRIIREIGHGGMGVVYEAEQVSLGRRVALKVLPWPGGRERNALERFRREARASARLHHTNIVPIFEVGQDGEVQYYAMQFIQGQSLDLVVDELQRLRGRSLRERGRRASPGVPKETRRSDSGASGLAGELGVARSLLSGQFDRAPTFIPAARSSLDDRGDSVPSGPVVSQTTDPSALMPGGEQLSSVESRHRAFHRGVAHIGRQVAAALAHAHARGILHRDIKPSNLLLDTEGVVWVSDFGLAKVDDDELTKTGDILGTLRYMAPERFRGQGDARADVYSLGLTLYELLTLRPAFDSPDRLALSEQIRTVEPPRPRSLDPRIPRDLETIVLKAIEKGPGDRYATAEAMAEDLWRFLNDEPILARRASAPERYARWARRNPVIAALGGLLTAVLLVATISSVLVARRMSALARLKEGAARSERDAKLDAQAAQARADSQRQRAEQHLYIARIGQAEGALRLYDAATARGLLDLCCPGPGEPDRRGWEWFYLDQWCRPELRTLALPTTAESHSVAVSPDGRLLAVGCAAPFTMGTRENPPVPAYVVSLPDGRVRHELVGHTRLVNAVTFRPDGKRLATLGDEGMIRVWDIGSGRQLRAIRVGAPFYPASGVALGLHWSPDGRRLATANGNGPIRIWDPETGQETARMAQQARSVAWSPDGTRIAAGGGSGMAVLAWDARDDRPRGPVIAGPGLINSLTWTPDGRRLAAVSAKDEDGSPGWGLTVWDTTSGERVLRKEHVSDLWSVASSPDGTRLATGGMEGIVRMFDAADGRECAALFTGCHNVSGLAFSSDGRRLYAGGWGMGGVKVFDPARDPRGRRCPGWPRQSPALTFDREGLRIFGIDWEADGPVYSADPVDGTIRADRVLAVTDARRFPRGDFAFSADARLLAAPTRRDHTIVGVWDVAAGWPVAMLRGSGGPVTAVAFSPDGRSVATAAAGAPDGRPRVTLWDVAAGRAIRTFGPGPDLVLALAFSGDGHRLAAGGGASRDAPGWVAVWDAETGAVLGTLDRIGSVMSLAFHPDGARLAVADNVESKVHLWDLPAGTHITRPGPGSVSCVEFTSDGKRLAVLGYDGNLHLADARTGDEVLVLRGFSPPPGSSGFTPRLAFSHDGTRLAANTADGSLNLWDLGTASGLAVDPEAGDLAGWLRRSRALAERADTAGAEAASAHARAIPGGDASSWIEHAVSLWRRGESLEARDAMDRALGLLPDDPGRCIDLGRLLARFGRAKESETVLAKARSLLERRLARTPDDEAAAAALAELLPDAGGSPIWTLLHPSVLTSAAGAALTPLPDGSVLAGGRNPGVDTFTVEARTALVGVTALRLEALPDPSLMASGPGRSDNGNFVLNGIRLTTEPESAVPIPVRLTSIRVDYRQTIGLDGISGTLVADSDKAWAIWPQIGRPHWAVFQAAQPFGTATGTRLRVELAFRTRFACCTLGRFRLSVTDRPFPHFLARLLLQTIRADTERSGLTRLGTAYILLDEWAPAADVLARAAARPDATALDDFLLALARHHLGRRDEARSDCDRALGRSGSGLADEATRDVAVDALMTTRGLGVDEAEALLLDVAFPADPFAR
jgi:eukaryotic-like serine/threonine-protein kinase